MLWRSRRFHFSLSLLVVATIALACGTVGEPEERTPAPRQTPADAGAIRAIEFQTVPAVEAVMRQFGAVSVDREAVIYADLTQDLREEAVIPIATGGTQGNVAYVVLTLRSGTAQAILTRTVDRTTRSGLKMHIEDGRLIETVGVYGPEDPLCCPSQLRVTYFRWDGNTLQVEREETVPNPTRPRS
jgi:hypothetical protein